MDSKDYLSECHRQLNDTKYYKPVEKDPTTKFARKVAAVVKEARSAGVIDADMQTVLTPNQPRPGRFYTLPKIHKNYDRIPVGRPIISGCGTATEKISLYVDLHLQPFVKTLPSYVEDDNDFLRKLIMINSNYGPLPQDTILCTMDVTSLYTNIPTDEFIAAAQHYLVQKHSASEVDILIKFMDLVLTQNNFELAGKHYIQILGTAIGTRMAPSGACLFMGRLEEDFLSEASHKPLIWLRYIDDIFLIWTHGQEELDNFITFCNTRHPTIKFTKDQSQKSISFLDVMVNLSNGYLETDLYSKPTDTHQYLQWSSCHPKHTKESLPYSLAFRLRRICSSDEALTNRVVQLKQYLIHRGYPAKVIDIQIQKAVAIPRSEALQPQEKKISSRVPFVLTYNPVHSTIATTIHKYLPILHSSSRCKEAIPDPPMVAFRRTSNIKDILVRSTMKDPEAEAPNLGFHPCQKCAACSHQHSTKKVHHMIAGRSFQSTVTGETFDIQHGFHCTSTNVVYLITCRKCLMQYVGETKRTLKIRLLEHCGDTKHKRDKPVARHFNLPGHTSEDITIMAIDRPGSISYYHRLALESKWIRELNTITPEGINVKGSF